MWIASALGWPVPGNVQKGYLAIVLIIAIIMLVALIFGAALPFQIIGGRSLTN